MDNKTKIIVLLSIIIIALLLVIINQNSNITTNNKVVGIYYTNDNNYKATIELKKDNTCIFPNEKDRECTYIISDNKVIISLGGYYDLMQDNKLYETIPYYNLDLCNSVIDEYYKKQKIDNLSCKPTKKEYEGLIVDEGIYNG